MEELVNFLKQKAEGEALSVVNMKGGAAIELIDLEIERVLYNIDDTNTSGKDRKVVFEIVFKPNEDKTTTSFEIVCKSVLAGPDPVKGAAIITTGQNGKPQAEEINRQKQIPFNNVTKMGGRE